MRFLFGPHTSMRAKSFSIAHLICQSKHWREEKKEVTRFLKIKEKSQIILLVSRTKLTNYNLNLKSN